MATRTNIPRLPAVKPAHPHDDYTHDPDLSDLEGRDYCASCHAETTDEAYCDACYGRCSRCEMVVPRDTIRFYETRDYGECEACQRARRPKTASDIVWQDWQDSQVASEKPAAGPSMWELVARMEVAAAAIQAQNEARIRENEAMSDFWRKVDENRAHVASRSDAATVRNGEYFPPTNESDQSHG